MFTASLLQFEVMRYINERSLNRRMIPFISNISYQQFKKVFCDRHISRLLHAPGQNITSVLLSGFTPEHTAHIVMMNVLYDFTYMASESKDMEIFSRSGLLKKARHFSMHVGDPKVLPFREKTFEAAIFGDIHVFSAVSQQLSHCMQPRSTCLVITEAEDNLKEIHAIIDALTVKNSRAKHEVIPPAPIQSSKPLEWKTMITFIDIPSYLAFLFSLPQFSSLSLESHYDVVTEVLTKLYEGKDTITVTVHFVAHELSV